MPVEVFSRVRTAFPLASLEKIFERLLVFAKCGQAQLELRLVGEKTIRQLNRNYLGKDAITDVLSFPLEPTPPFARGPWHLGEVVVALPVAKRQAQRAGRTLLQQVVRLAVHGLVHVQGYDHEKNIEE